MSWKVRRAATKLLTSVIETRSDLLRQLYKTVVPSLISRFCEREESVRADILHAFIVLLRQTNIYVGDGYASETTNDFDLDFSALGSGGDYDSKKEKMDLSSSVDDSVER